MLLRLLSLLVALALVWNGLATQELPVAAAGAPDVAADTERPRGVVPGSVEDHQLDDQPQQAQAETLADTAGLFFAARLPAPPAAASAAPPLALAALLPCPCLDGPHRPPCGASAIG